MDFWTLSVYTIILRTGYVMLYTILRSDAAIRVVLGLWR